MRGGKRESKGRKKREVISKMPRVEFDLEAIKEIKERKKGIHRRWSKKRR